MRSHGDTFDDITVDDDFKQKLTTDYTTAGLSETNRLILGFAETITKEAHTVDRAYIDFLKSKGFSEEMIHDIVQVSAYFNYVNRLTDALGVELEG